MSEPARSDPVSDGRLEIQIAIDDAVDRAGRVPMRTAVLRFRNVAPAPLRIFLHRSEVFRAGISTVVLFVPGNALVVPDLHPHGYVVTEVDFPLLEPGEAREFPQRFTLDPLVPGGARTERRTGFEPGATARVRWTYENGVTQWAAGVATLDGPTRALFGGGPIPHIWTGRLVAETRWVVPS